MAFAALNAALTAAIEAHNHHVQSALRLTWTTEEITRLQAELDQLRAAVSLEEQDVARLKEGGLVGLWYELIGRRADLLAKEEKEAAVARLRLIEAEEMLETLAGQQSELQAELDALGETAHVLEDLMKQKRRLIQAKYPEAAERLLALEEEERRLQALQARLTRATAAGARVLDLLDQVAETLRAAHRIASSDVVSDFLKYGKLSDANRQARKVREALTEFQRELPGLDLPLRIPTVEISGRTQFADMVTDSPLAKRAVWSRITEGFGDVKLIQGELQMLMKQIDRQAAQVATDLEMARFKREMLLTSFESI